MADIELVVKIPEEIYEIAKQDLWKWPADDVYNAIKNGVPIPKEHGRLIDADELDEDKQIMTTIFGESKYAVLMDDIRKIPTIIEADKESEKEK